MSSENQSNELEVQDLRVHYDMPGGHVRAVDDVSFKLARGETLGLVGESACGKTTVGLSILRLLPRNGRIVGGHILLGDRDIAAMAEDELRKIRWRRISMIFQGAMNALNPVAKVGDQLADVLKLHEKLDDGEVKARIEKAIDKVGIPREMFRRYPHEFSGGMRQRAIIAMSLLCNPEFVIADEPTTGLDVIVQQQILDEIKKLQGEHSTGILLVSHDISLIAQTCDYVAVTYAGKIFEYGDLESIFYKSRNPYTRALLASFPKLHGKVEMLESIPGNPPDLSKEIKGCRYAPRCPYAQEICQNDEPPLVPLNDGRLSRCHFAERPIW
jgi:peptide/nickel transport system ATP-binding protein